MGWIFCDVYLKRRKENKSGKASLMKNILDIVENKFKYSISL